MRDDFEAIQHYKSRGLWIRMLGDPARELEKLGQWREQTDEALCTHEPHAPGEIPDYSALTYIKADMPLSLFSMQANFGVLVQPKGRDIPFWQDGDLSGITKRLDYTQRELAFRQGETDRDATGHQFSDISEEAIAAHVEGADFTRTFLRRDTQSWNEGLFRYKADDVVGMVVTTDYDLDCEEFEDFMFELDQYRTKDGSVPVLFFEERTGKLWQVDDHIRAYLRIAYDGNKPKHSEEFEQYGEGDLYEYPPYHPGLDLELDSGSMYKQYKHIQRDEQSMQQAATAANHPQQAGVGHGGGGSASSGGGWGSGSSAAAAPAQAIDVPPPPPPGPVEQRAVATGGWASASSLWQQSAAQRGSDTARSVSPSAQRQSQALAADANTATRGFAQ